MSHIVKSLQPMQNVHSDLDDSDRVELPTRGLPRERGDTREKRERDSLVQRVERLSQKTHHHVLILGLLPRVEQFSDVLLSLETREDLEESPSLRWKRRERTYIHFNLQHTSSLDKVGLCLHCSELLSIDVLYLNERVP